MAAGGRREGAGRKPNQANKVQHSVKVAVAEIAQRYTQEALETLVAIMKNDEAPAAARAAAANSLLDRGHGKPTQHVEHELDVSRLTDEQIDAIAAAWGAAPTAPQGVGGDRAPETIN